MGKLAKVVSSSFPNRGQITQVQLIEFILKKVKSYVDYHDECTIDNDNALAKYPER